MTINSVERSCKFRNQPTFTMGKFKSLVKTIFTPKISNKLTKLKPDDTEYRIFGILGSLSDELSSENAQDPPQLATTLSSGTAVQSSMGPNFGLTPIACFVIFCLHFLDCDLEGIFRVLESYGWDATILDVARYIEQEGLIKYHETTGLRHGRTAYIRSPGTTLRIDFREWRPVHLAIRASSITALSPKEIMPVVTSDGHQIITVITDGELRCWSAGATWTVPCFWDEDPLAPPRPRFLSN